MGLETNQPAGSRDNPAEYSHPAQVKRHLPRGGERAALTVSPLSSFNQVPQTQPCRGMSSLLHVALPAPMLPGLSGGAPRGLWQRWPVAGEGLGRRRRQQARGGHVQTQLSRDGISPAAE